MSGARTAPAYRQKAREKGLRHNSRAPAEEGGTGTGAGASGALVTPGRPSVSSASVGPRRLYVGPMFASRGARNGKKDMLKVL